jgi:hypothetical protein
MATETMTKMTMVRVRTIGTSTMLTAASPLLATEMTRLIKEAGDQIAEGEAPPAVVPAALMKEVLAAITEMLTLRLLPRSMFPP